LEPVTFGVEAVEVELIRQTPVETVALVEVVVEQ
jgi:hypothetical protein